MGSWREGIGAAEVERGGGGGGGVEMESFFQSLKFTSFTSAPLYLCLRFQS